VAVAAAAADMKHGPGHGMMGKMGSVGMKGGGGGGMMSSGGMMGGGGGYGYQGKNNNDGYGDATNEADGAKTDNVAWNNIDVSTGTSTAAAAAVASSTYAAYSAPVVTTSSSTTTSSRTGSPCTLTVFTASTPNFIFTDPMNPFGTPGDQTLISEPLYVGTPGTSPEVNTVVGVIVGTCIVIDPTITSSCTFTAYYDDGIVSGGFSFTGALFDPLPSTLPQRGEYNVVGTRGDFAHYTGGIVDSHTNDVGNLIFVPNFC
jgi:hypothetical protein